MKTSELEYELPDGRVALAPAEPRDSARMMVVSRSDPSRVEHRMVRDLPGLLQREDLLVFNTSRVIPARLMGVRSDTGGRVEGLYLSQDRSGDGSVTANERWVVLLRAKRLSVGVTVDLDEPQTDVHSTKRTVRLRLLARHAVQAGAWVVEVESSGGWNGFRAPPGGSALDSVGRTPLPPYILKARKDTGFAFSESADRARYQTVYATSGSSVAAPTAGLHFTPALLRSLAECGVGRADVRLDVGPGTFRPVEVERVEDHSMHSEWCSVEAPAAGAVRASRERGGRVIAVGTTSARTLETFANALESGDGPWPAEGETKILITPGYRWRCIDGLLTNFHLPRSTLLAMVGALFPGGVERVKNLYAAAIQERYRFFSFGDAMLILP